MTSDRARKKKIRDIVKATGKPYSVAAREVEQSEQYERLSPFQALMVGYMPSKPSGYAERALLSPSYDEADVAYAATERIRQSSLQQTFRYWMVPYVELAISSGDMDRQTIVDFGHALRVLNDRGNYFSYHHRILEFVAGKAATFTLLGKKPAQPNLYANLEKVFETLRHDISLAKDENTYLTNGMDQFRATFWPLLAEHQQRQFLHLIALFLLDLPPAYELNTGVVYHQYSPRPPVPKQSWTVGQKVKFSDGRFWWTVRSLSKDFAVLTRKQTFSKAEEQSVAYTVVQWDAGLRGAHNSWGFGAETDEEVQTLVEALQAYHDFEARTAKLEGLPIPPQVQIGRNRVTLSVEVVKAS